MWALWGVSQGFLPNVEAFEVVLGALAAAGLRHGIANK